MSELQLLFLLSTDMLCHTARLSKTNGRAERVTGGAESGPRSIWKIEMTKTFGEVRQKTIINEYYSTRRPMCM